LHEESEDDRLLSVAASIANGTTIDWDEVRQANPADAHVVDELRIVGDIAKLHSGLQGWGSLTILGPIGEGSAGTVYRALDPDLHREVALKIVRTQSPPGIEPAAVREARRLARVRHPNVVTVYSAEHKEGEVAVAMELIAGKTLDVLVRMQGPYSARETAIIGCDVARALAAIHGAGLLHGDIKAHNVMREDGGRIVVMDFSAGRDLQTTDVSFGDFAGTPVYIAPEVFRGEPRSARTDIYSLGVLLFYLATARYPVDGRTRTAVERHHRDGAQPRRLRDLRPDLPDAFVRCVERAMADDPTQRYASAGEFEAALHRTIDGARRRTSPMLRLVVSAMVVLGAIGGAAYWYRTNRPPANDVGVRAATPSISNPLAGDYRVDVALFRADSGGPVRLRSGAHVKTGDRLYMQVETSIPTHVFVVNEDDRGSGFLLFPLPEQRGLNPLPAGSSHSLPHLRETDEKYFVVSSAGGREHFLVFVSPEPINAFAQVFAILPPPTTERAMLSESLPPGAVDLLRSVGGLTSTPPGTSLALNAQFTTPLPDGPSTTHGLWVRQITVENGGQ